MNAPEMTNEERHQMYRETAGYAPVEAPVKGTGFKERAEFRRAAQSEVRAAKKEVKQEQKAELKAQHKDAAANPQYHMEVNKGSMNMTFQTQRLNVLWAQGWKLHTALEQAGNTVFILERRA